MSSLSRRVAVVGAAALFAASALAGCGSSDDDKNKGSDAKDGDVTAACSLDNPPVSQAEAPAAGADLGKATGKVGVILPDTTSSTRYELYDRPLNLFVGGFIGSPAMNLLEATLERSNGGLTAVAGSQRIALGEETLAARPALRDYHGKPVILGIRPEDLEDAALEPETPPERTLAGKVELTEALGSEVMVHFAIDAPPALTDEVRELQKDSGADGMGAPTQTEGAGTTMVGRFGARSKARMGEPAKVAVDTRALHFFDPETGLGIYDGTKGDA